MKKSKFLNWSFLHWYVKQLAKQLGMAGLIGLALVIISIGFYLITFLPAQSQLIESKNNLAQLKSSATKHASAGTVRRNPTNEMSSFYATFPNGASLSNSLRLIQKTAINQNLELNRGDYKLILTQTTSQNDELARYELRFPISGKYTKMRAFVAEVMQKIPSLALTEMQIERESISSPSVDAQMVFVLFVKADVWR